MLNIKKRAIVMPIVLLLVVFLAMYLFDKPDIVGWNDFEREMKVEFTNIKSIGASHLTNPIIRIVFRLNKPFEKEDVEEIFLRTIEFLSNEETYNSLQDNHKEKFTYSAGSIIIIFKYNNKNTNIQCYYRASTEGEGNDFTFDSFRKWRINYQGDYLGIYELPQK